MTIKELTVDEFETFAKDHERNNFHQSLNYATLKQEEEYEFEFIGLFDGKDLKAAALVLVGYIKGYLYAYIPEGFLIDYTDKDLLRTFTDLLKRYYEKEDIVFIKINPSVPIYKINKNDFSKQKTEFSDLRSTMERIGYKYLGDNMHFESVLPRINVIKNIDGFNINKVSKNTRNKIKKAYRKGLVFEKVQNDKMDVFNNLIKNKINKKDFHYNDYYNVFNRNETVDLFLVSIDYNNYVSNSQAIYDKETENNKKYNELLLAKSSKKNINKKIDSDKKLLTYKDDVYKASSHLSEEKKYIAGAMCITCGNKATLLIAGYDKKYKDFAPNYFLYFNLMDYYRRNYSYFDLNGITAEFLKDKTYRGLNEFKLGFNPDIYEYVGEFDLVINRKHYDSFLRKGYLAEKFNK